MVITKKMSDGTGNMSSQIMRQVISKLKPNLFETDTHFTQTLLCNSPSQFTVQRPGSILTFTALTVVVHAHRRNTVQVRLSGKPIGIWGSHVLRCTVMF